MYLSADNNVYVMFSSVNGMCTAYWQRSDMWICIISTNYKRFMTTHLVPWGMFLLTYALKPEWQLTLKVRMVCFKSASKCSDLKAVLSQVGQKLKLIVQYTALDTCQALMHCICRMRSFSLYDQRQLAFVISATRASWMLFCSHLGTFYLQYCCCCHIVTHLKGSVKEPNKFHNNKLRKSLHASDMAEYIELFGFSTRDRHAWCI